MVIEKPIGIRMEMVETDDYLPSFKMQVEIQVKHPTGSYHYRADDIWFECAKWDLFVDALQKPGEDETLILLDMSELFSISLAKQDEQEFMLKLFCSEPETGSGQASLSFSKPIDHDQFHQFTGKFINFPKWWSA